MPASGKCPRSAFAHVSLPPLLRAPRPLKLTSAAPNRGYPPSALAEQATEEALALL